MKYQFSLLVLTVAAASAQFGTPGGTTRIEKSDSLDRIEGFNGRVMLSHSVSLRQTVIVLSSESELHQQVVLRLQHETSLGLPPEWSGAGRLLVGYGLVGVITEDGAHRIFRFADRRLPASLERLGPFESIAVVGIARYGGRDSQLSPEQIELLKSTGSCRVPAAGKTSGRSPVAYEAECGQGCSSGGQGSSACSINGCSVECQSGYFACCKQATLNCICCERPPH